MIDRVEQRFGVKPKRLIGDTAYGTAEMLGWMVKEKNIEPHVPVWDKGDREDGTFSRSDFACDAASNSLTCPNGKRLLQFHRTYERERSGVTKANMRLYRASKHDCDACALKQRCCPGQPVRKVMRSVHEDARDVARAASTTPAFEQSRRDRKKVEMLFAHLKRILKLDRLRLRGPSGAHDEFTLAATAQNLRKLAKLVTPPGLAMAPA
jgi:hypothetical protein